MKKINPCLWFDHQAEEAEKFYTSIFKNSKIGKVARYGSSGSEVSGQKEGTVMTAAFELEGLNIVGLNGGPIFKFSPAFSFFVSCESEQEIKQKWEKLSEGGKVRMGLDKYPWAEKYGWTADRFGVDWQLILSPRKEKIVPAFLFVDQLFGKGEEAIRFYTSLFKDSKIDSLSKDEKTKTVLHGSFDLAGQNFVLMEGSGTHNFSFTNATSLIINCETQNEIDKLWEKLSDGGTIEECGWLKDKYGVSWQVVPTVLEELMSSSDKEKSERVMKAMLKMKKLDIEKLKQA